MPINREAFLHIGFRERAFQIAHATCQAASLVRSERINRLSIEVYVLEKREHHLRISAPPYRTADEHGVVLAEVRSLALILRQLAVVGFLLGEFY